MTDDEYPVRVAFGLLNKITDEFQESFPKERYEKDVIKARSSGSSSGSSYKEMEWPALGTYLAKYQDPKQADTIMRVQQELDETKIVLVRPHYFTCCTQSILTCGMGPLAQDY